LRKAIDVQWSFIFMVNKNDYFLIQQ